MNIEQKHDYIIVTCRKSRLDSSSAYIFQKQLIKSLKTARQPVILDLHLVEYMDSSWLGTFLVIYNMLQAQGQLLSCGTGRHVKKLFRFTGMDKLFQFYDDVDTAEQMLQNRHASSVAFN